MVQAAVLLLARIPEKYLSAKSIDAPLFRGETRRKDLTHMFAWTAVDLRSTSRNRLTKFSGDVSRETTVPLYAAGVLV